MFEIGKSVNRTGWLVSLILFSMIGISFGYSQTNKKNKKSVIENGNEVTPLQFLKGDTLNLPNVKTDNTFMPGKIGDVYTAQQDSNYFRAMKLKISAISRFVQDLKRFEASRLTEKEMSSGAPLSIASKNMNLPNEILSPSNQEIAMYQYNQMQAFNVPFVNTYNPMSGMRVSLSAIGQFLGLVEDVSPNLEYKMDYSTDVEVVVYSMQASVIATLFKGLQTPGSYKFTWNARDDKGRKVASGDYIGEIRIGKEKYIRKRIYIP